MAQVSVALSEGASAPVAVEGGGTVKQGVFPDLQGIAIVLLSSAELHA